MASAFPHWQMGSLLPKAVHCTPRRSYFRKSSLSLAKHGASSALPGDGIHPTFFHLKNNLRHPSGVPGSLLDMSLNLTFRVPGSCSCVTQFQDLPWGCGRFCLWGHLEMSFFKHGTWKQTNSLHGVIVMQPSWIAAGGLWALPGLERQALLCCFSPLMLSCSPGRVIASGI